MNKVLIVDNSESDRRLISCLLSKSAYEPIAVDALEDAKSEVMKLSPGAVIVSAMCRHYVLSPLLSRLFQEPH